MVPEGKVKVTGYATKRKKYITSWFLPLCAYLVTESLNSSFFFQICFVGIAIAVGIFYLFLRELSYDKSYMYLNSLRVSFENLKALDTYDLNLQTFIILKCSVNGRKKNYFVVHGNLGLISLVLEIFGMNSHLGKWGDFLTYA